MTENNFKILKLLSHGTRIKWHTFDRMRWLKCASNFRSRTKIAMTSPFGLCAVVMVTNVISQHAAVGSSLSTHLWDGVSVWRNEKLLYSHSKHAISLKELHHRISRSFNNDFIYPKNLPRWTRVQDKGLNLTTFVRHTRSTNAILIAVYNIAVTKPESKHKIGSKFLGRIAADTRSCWTFTKRNNVQIAELSRI